MVTSVELYEALKKTVGQEAAQLMVDELARTDQVATKADFKALEAATKADFKALEAATKADFKVLEAATKADLATTKVELIGELHAMEARTYRWVLGFFATQWLAIVGLIVTLVVKL